MPNLSIENHTRRSSSRTDFPTSPNLAPLRAPLKWAGGKKWQLPHLLPLWTPERCRRLVEPFCGGLAVTLGLRPQSALLNDVNPHLINFYKWLRRGLHIRLALKNESKYYYARRAHFNTLIATGKTDSREAAAHFYYLNRTGYNGLCRFNRSGYFNVPLGRYKEINYRRDFADYVATLKKWKFSCTDFERIDLEPDDFVYADPPYDVPFTHYSKGGFGWEEQRRTAQWLAHHPGPVVLANQATKRIVELYEELGYRIMLVDAPRRISCTGDRKPVKEVLALRNLS